MMKEEIVNLGLQIVPKSKEIDSYSLVDIAIEVIKTSGVPYVVTPFETVMEGPQEQLMKVALEAQRAVMDAGAEEVLVYIRIHAHKHLHIRMADKTEKHSQTKAK
jgi:uncharacterized protein YqgV (UPF0045/DUF77 family)